MIDLRKYKITLNGIEPGMSISEASRIVGPLFLSVRDQGESVGVNEYVSEHVADLKVFTEPNGDIIKTIHAGSIQIEDRLVLPLGSRKSAITELLGEDCQKKGNARQIWSYDSVGLKKIGLNFTFDEDMLIGISTIDFEALAFFKKAKEQERREKQ